MGRCINIVNFTKNFTNKITFPITVLNGNAFKLIFLIVVLLSLFSLFSLFSFFASSLSLCAPEGSVIAEGGCFGILWPKLKKASLELFSAKKSTHTQRGEVLSAKPLENKNLANNQSGSSMPTMGDEVKTIKEIVEVRGSVELPGLKANIFRLNFESDAHLPEVLEDGILINRALSLAKDAEKSVTEMEMEKNLELSNSNESGESLPKILSGSLKDTKTNYSKSSDTINDSSSSSPYPSGQSAGGGMGEGGSKFLSNNNSNTSTASPQGTSDSSHLRGAAGEGCSNSIENQTVFNLEYSPVNNQGICEIMPDSIYAIHSPLMPLVEWYTGLLNELLQIMNITNIMLNYLNFVLEGGWGTIFTILILLLRLILLKNSYPLT